MPYLTGFHAIEEKIKADPTAGPLLVAKAGPRAREIVELAQKARVRVDRTGTTELGRLAGENRGIALHVEIAAPGSPDSPDIDLGQFLEELGGAKKALVIMLDEVTDPHNYGAILRSADQFGADLVITRNARVARHADVVAKTSSGAAAWVKSAETPNLSRAIDELKEHDFWIYGADMGGETVYNTDLKGRICRVLGGEAGLSRLLRESCDILVSIPAVGKLDSLNVSVACGIILYEVYRQNHA
jgi:23S rRNA (guanosine2251-2'-O)-methyltransferase